VDLFFEILKWVLLVFVAGVIGQIGKSLTLRVIERRRRRALSSPPSAPEPKEQKALQKAAKKRAKAEAKRLKKMGQSPMDGER